MLLIGLGGQNKVVSIIVLYAVALHLWWALMLFIDDGVSLVTGIAAIRYVLPWPCSIPAMIIAAFLAIAAFMVKNKFLSATMMVPQQFLLFISAGGAIEAITTGHFADGVIRPITFLMADLADTVLTAAGHSLAIYGMARMAWLNGQS